MQIGTSSPRLDAYDKVTGREKYAADVYGQNPIWAGVKRAGVPHAKIEGIGVDAARRLPGVIAVLTHKDVPGTNRQGVVKKDQPVLANDKVRHCGDGIALVLAESREVLKTALDLITLDLKPLPGVFDMEEALAEGAPLVHDDNPGGNVLLQAELQTGSGPAAEVECEVMVEACFETPRQEHAYLETEAGWAQVQDDGRLVIISSTQTPFRDRAEVAEALGLPMERLRMIAPFPGGAFGGKDGVSVQSLLGLAALHAAGRPVKMWWDREESFLASCKRHPTRMYYRLGATRDGSLRYLDARLYFDTGPYDHLGGVVLTLAFEHAGGPYRIPNAHLRGWAVYTNNPVSGPFRGFGVPQVTSAIERVMDQLAAKLSMDPLELRLKNALKKGDRNCVGTTLTCSTGLVECLEQASNHAIWMERQPWKAASGPFTRRGVGVAALMQASGYGPVVPDYANAKIELTAEGKVRVYCGVVDMGQGTAATSLQIAGSILGQEADRMELVLPDTDLCLPCGSASASRCTYTFGNALIGAAEALRKRILERSADLLMAADINELALVSGKVRCMRTGREFDLAALAGLMSESERVAVHHFRTPVAREEPSPDRNLRLHGLPHCLFSYGAHVARVEVDELTGAVKVERYLSVTDCGNVVNPRIYEQQIHGGIAQGLGYALSEDLEVTEGRIMTQDFSTYVIPTAKDVPDMDCMAVNIHEPTGPFGLKGVGEIAMNGPLPALANAVADACGVGFLSSPLTPEAVLKAMRQTNQFGEAT